MENEKLPQYVDKMGELAKSKYSEFAIFRTNLKMLIAFKDVTRKELCETLSAKSQKRVDDLIEGRTPPKIEEILTLSKFFEVPIDSLLYQKAKVSFEYLTAAQ